jgi:hypothetical protein
MRRPTSSADVENNLSSTTGLIRIWLNRTSVFVSRSIFDLPGFIGPMISRKWRAPGSLLRLFERTVPA